MGLKHKILKNQSLALSIGVIYLWFGVLKYFPEVSPAEKIAKDTISILTFQLIPSNISIILLAIWESLVGVLLILNIYRKATIIMALIHIILTFSTLFLFTEQVFINPPFHLTLLGQYIFKNLIILVSLIILYKQTKSKDS